MLDFTRLDEVRRRRPLIHCVSNIVTANDCANLALAVGASPMMAQAPEEMEAISAVSDVTVLNTGTPDAEKFRACRICAASARHPVVLDPVGVGASPWRLGQVRALLDLFTPSILRVNLGEARALLGTDGQEQGVDSPLSASREARRDTAMDLARRRGTAVLLSGPEDLITDGARVWCVTGGSGRMSLVTGTGCMLSVLCGVFAAFSNRVLQRYALFKKEILGETVKQPELVFIKKYGHEFINEFTMLGNGDTELIEYLTKVFLYKILANNRHVKKVCTAVGVKI